MNCRVSSHTSSLNRLESMLTLLARGESFSHRSDSDGVPISRDYLDAVFSLGQEDIQLLMPESKRVHEFSVEEWVNSDIYDDSNLSGQKSDKITLSDINESRMASADEEQELVFNPSDAEKSILQRTSNSSGSMNTSVTKGFKSLVTAPGLVSNKTLRDLNAKIEKL